MNEHVETLSHVKATVVDLAIRFGPKIFVAIVIPFPQYEVRMLGNAV